MKPTFGSLKCVAKELLQESNALQEMYHEHHSGVVCVEEDHKGQILAVVRKKKLSLYGEDITGLPSYYILSRMCADENLFGCVEVCLRYIFAHASEKKWVNMDKLEFSSMIHHIVMQHSRMHFKGIQYKRNTGFTLEGRKRVFHSILNAYYIFCNEKDSLVKSATLVAKAIDAAKLLRDFLERVAIAKAEVDVLYDDTFMKRLWNKILRFLDESLRMGGMCSMDEKHSVRCMEKVCNDDDDRIGQRLMCWIHLLKPDVLQYPPGTEFNPIHPCDMFLRGMMGKKYNQITILKDHEKMMQVSVDCRMPTLDDITRYITSRKYSILHLHSKDISTFEGCIPKTSNEALVHHLMMPVNKPTVASEYDPLGDFTIDFVPCNKLPSIDFKDAVEKAYWEMISEEMRACESHTKVGLCISTIKTNFLLSFNKHETSLCKNMMQIDDIMDTEDTQVQAKMFAQMATLFMRGPVLSCACRYKCSQVILKNWCIVEQDADANVLNVLQTMHCCSMILYSAVKASRHKSAIVCIKSGPTEGKKTLRKYLLKRVVQMKESAVPDGLMKVDFTDENLKVVLDVLPQGCFEGLVRWMQLPCDSSRGFSREYMAKRIAWWVVEYMPSRGVGDVCCPEPMGASLAFLDRVSIFCAVCSCIDDGEDFDDNLLMEGMDSEMYEWDPSFVRRLLLGRDPIKKESSSLITIMNWLVSMFLVGCYEGDDDTKLGRCLKVKGEQFGLHSWFEKHMDIYGMIYEHYHRTL